MRAIVTDSFGGPEVLRLAEVPDPAPTAGELLIRVRASGVNRADLLQRQGHYPPPPGISDIIGLEISGVVAAVGPDLTGWTVENPVSPCWPAGATPSWSRSRPARSSVRPRGSTR